MTMTRSISPLQPSSALLGVLFYSKHGSLVDPRPFHFFSFAAAAAAAAAVVVVAAAAAVPVGVVAPAAVTAFVPVLPLPASSCCPFSSYS